MAGGGGPGRSRRPRGAEPLVKLSAVPVRTRDAVNDVADALGISVSQYLQDLIERDVEARAREGQNAGDHSAA